MPGDNHAFFESFRKAMLASGLTPASVQKPVDGVVSTVYEDEMCCDVLVGGDDGKQPGLYSKVPVKSPLAGDGFGIYVLPEEGASVSLSFDNFNMTQPKIDAAQFLIGNRTPLGGRIGSIVFALKDGQRFALRADTGEVVFRSLNVDDECAGSRNIKTVGAVHVDTLGDHDERIAGSKTKLIEGNALDMVLGQLKRIIGPRPSEGSKNPAENAIFEEYTDYETLLDPDTGLPLDGQITDEHGNKTSYDYATIVHGSQAQAVEGKLGIDVGGDRTVTVGGNDTRTVMGDVMQMVAGALTILVGGLSLEPPYGVALDPLTHLPVAVMIGAPFGMNYWGGVAAGAAPMVNGTLLATALTAFLNSMNIALGTLAGAFSGPNPVTGTQLASALGTYAGSMVGLVQAFTSGLTAALSKNKFLGGPTP